MANFKHVQSTNGVCPQTHVHAPWGLVKKGAERVFATSLEVHYPQQLCDAISNAFILFLISQGWVAPAATISNAAAKAVSGLPQATAKLPPLIPEYKMRVMLLRDHANTQLWPVQPH